MTIAFVPHFREASWDEALFRPIEFWTATGRQESRRARLVYTPGAADARAARPTLAELVDDDADGELSGEWVQTSI